MPQNGNFENGHSIPDQRATQHNGCPLRVPTIRVNDRDLHEIANDAQRALEVANDPPQIFLRGGSLVHIGKDEQHNPYIMLLRDAALRDRLSQTARFFRIKEKKDELEVIVVSPPNEVARVLLARDNWRLPPLRGITEVPVLRPDGSVVTTPGYDPASRLIYLPAEDLLVPLIPPAPTRQDIVDAARFLLHELLGDFPFVTDDGERSASQANALGLLLTPILRPMCDGLVPLALLDKPQPGTGGSLYAEVVATIATGRPASVMTAPNRDEEWRKRITSILARGATMITIDNVDGVLDAPSLGAVLTAWVWSDRILGRSETVTVTHQATWMATGNNMVLRGDLPRRCYWIRMNAKTARPWQRQHFRHPNLLVWVAEHRGEILAHLLTMARGWVVAGKPAAAVPPLGNFTPWAHTIGSILAYAGVQGFLGNLNHLYDQMDPHTAQWGAFLQAWHHLYGSKALTLASVVTDMRNDNSGYQALREALPEDLSADLHVYGGKNTARLERRLGNAFKKLQDRYFEHSVHLQKAGEEKHATKWRVIHEGDNDTEARVCE